MKRLMDVLVFGVALRSLCCGAAAQTIVVGGKAFTEQQIMTAMTVALLKAKGFTPERKAGMGSAAVRAALENGQIDVYWEYTVRRSASITRSPTSFRRPMPPTRRSRSSTRRRGSSGSTCRRSTTRTASR
jgi:glycine betaine/choline ABC-type transport system substrate-binding protein